MPLTAAIHAVLQKGGLPLIIGAPAHSNILSHSEDRYPWQDWVLVPAGKARKGITPHHLGASQYQPALRRHSLPGLYSGFT